MSATKTKLFFTVACFLFAGMISNLTFTTDPDAYNVKQKIVEKVAQAKAWLTPTKHGENFWNNYNFVDNNVRSNYDFFLASLQTKRRVGVGLATTAVIGIPTVIGLAVESAKAK